MRFSKFLYSVFYRIPAKQEDLRNTQRHIASMMKFWDIC